MNADATGRVLAPYDRLQRADSALHRDLAPLLSMSYVARRGSTYVVIDPSERDRMQRLGGTLGDTPQGAYVRALTAYGRRTGRGGPAPLPRGTRPLSARCGTSLRGCTTAPRCSGARHRIAGTGRCRTGTAGDEPKLVLDAITLAAQEQWDDLVPLDPALAAISWVKPWAIDALQVRLDWRTRAPRHPRHAAHTPTRPCPSSTARSSCSRPLRCSACERALRSPRDRPEMIVEFIELCAQAMYATAARLPAGASRTRARTTLQGLAQVLHGNGRPLTFGRATRAQAVRSKVLDQLGKL